MFWADRLTEEIKKRFDRGPIVIRDEKTLSGRVHIGSMRGAAIHGLLAENLSAQGIPTTFWWEHNDFDVFDSVPSYLPQEIFVPHLGKLLRDVPSPDPSAPNFAAYYAQEFARVIEQAGFHPRFYWGSELYLSGAMDPLIHEALAHVGDIQRIYKEVSGSHRAEEWLPLSLICPRCSKIATTEAFDFDGKTVAVRCIADKVPWTAGCGFEGRESPFGGRAKLLWKVEWAAKWKAKGVMVEGSGKDLSTKGGARDVANHVALEVFGYEPPFDVPYEFFLVGGKKMSSSKGRGSSAAEIAALMPPKIFRLALLGKDITQAINFDPEGDTLPVLYDQYDKLAEHYRTTQTDDYGRLFQCIHVGRFPEDDLFTFRFSQVAFLTQMPHLSLEAEAEKLKGVPLTPAEREELTQRAKYARVWLDLYAPERFVFKLQEHLPAEARMLNAAQKTALATLLQYLEGRKVMPDGDTLHHELHAIKESQPIPAGELFSAIYLVFLGKSFGPKAGWFLSVLPRELVLTRLREAQ